MIKIKIQNRFILILTLITLLTGSLSFAGSAFAATYMNHASVIEYNMVASGTSQVVVEFTAGAADSGNVTVNFAGWTGAGNGTVNSTQAVGTVGCQVLTGASNALPGSLTANGAGATVTVSSVNALTAGQSYCFNLTSASAVTNPTATGQTQVTITDQTDSAITSINNISNDQITVSAVVPPSFTLALGGSTDSFISNLSSAALTSTTGVVATINTNATSGWGLWAEDTQGGLRSTLASHTISSVATGSNTAMNGGSIGTEKYALGVTTANATTNYADAGGITGGGLSTTIFNQIATSAVPALNATATIKELADISSTSQAAQDYSDVITVVGAGSF